MLTVKAPLGFYVLCGVFDVNDASLQHIILERRFYCESYVVYFWAVFIFQMIVLPTP